MIKALATKGKYKGKVFTVSQWCNDWFTVDEVTHIFSPRHLAFTSKGMHEIQKHENNGLMFAWFEVVQTKSECGEYLFTFKKKNL